LDILTSRVSPRRARSLEDGRIVLRLRTNYRVTGNHNPSVAAGVADAVSKRSVIRASRRSSAAS
jgi:hypothetical protein